MPKKHIRVLFLSLGLCLGLVPSALAQAKPAPAKAKAQYIPVRAFRNAAEAGGFLDLAKRKQVAEEDATVVDRLLKEKESEFQQLAGQLQRDFGVMPDQEYEYDSEKKIVFTKKTDKDGGVLREPLREFKVAESEQDFLKLVEAKRLTFTAINTLRLLALEKRKEKELLDEKLEREYTITARKDYYYDAKKMTLYEVQGGS